MALCGPNAMIIKYRCFRQDLTIDHWAMDTAARMPAFTNRAALICDLEDDLGSVDAHEVNHEGDEYVKRTVKMVDLLQESCLEYHSSRF